VRLSRWDATTPLTAYQHTTKKHPIKLVESKCSEKHKQWQLAWFTFACGHERVLHGRTPQAGLLVRRLRANWPWRRCDTSVDTAYQMQQAGCIAMHRRLWWPAAMHTPESQSTVPPLLVSISRPVGTASS
jgi:hypothetical protein